MKAAKVPKLGRAPGAPPLLASAPRSFAGPVLGAARRLSLLVMRNGRFVSRGQIGSILRPAVGAIDSMHVQVHLE